MKIGNNSLKFNGVYIKDSSTAVGPLESAGPLKDYFDYRFPDLYCNADSWEKAEINLVKTCIDDLIKKTNLSDTEIDFIVGGDLNNQDAVTNYAVRDYNIPLLGVYSACATSAEAMIVASSLVDSANAKNIIVTSSSHNATAERQYRNPTEYGGARPDSATFTVTGAGTCLITNQKSDIKIESATIGRVLDAKQKDANDMGSAMAPAASQTIKVHLEDLGRSAEYYDLILTGDLSSVGKPILIDILKEQEIDIEHNHNDCGLLIYDRKKQNVFAGGSGAGCSSAVTFGYIMSMLRENKLKKVLLVATGALMNPIMIFQKESIPAIAHAVSLEKI